MLDVFRAAGFRSESRSIEYGVVHLAFDIEPTGASLAAGERRAWTAGVNSIARILRPRSVAVIGAGRDPTGIGHAVLRNLIQGGFSGSIYPVNPNVDNLLGLPCARSVDAVEGHVDLAVLAVPASRCLEAVDACARKGVHGLVVITSGFAEVGSVRRRAAARVAPPRSSRWHACRRAQLFRGDQHRSGRRLNATFASRVPVPGNIAFASQSGALGIAILEQARASGLGVSSFVSMGNKSDVSSNDLLRYWHQDGADEGDPPLPRIVRQSARVRARGAGGVRVPRRSSWSSRGGAWPGRARRRRTRPRSPAPTRWSTHSSNRPA